MARKAYDEMSKIWVIATILMHLEPRRIDMESKNIIKSGMREWRNWQTHWT